MARPGCFDLREQLPKTSKSGDPLTKINETVKIKAMIRSWIEHAFGVSARQVGPWLLRAVGIVRARPPNRFACPR